MEDAAEALVQDCEERLRARRVHRAECLGYEVDAMDVVEQTTVGDAAGEAAEAADEVVEGVSEVENEAVMSVSPNQP